MLAYVKTTGFLMILLGSTGIGLVISSSFSKRVLALQDIKSFLVFCETAVADIGMDTVEILKQSPAYLKTGVKNLIGDICMNIDGDYPERLTGVWKEQVGLHRQKSDLKDGDWDLFLGIGDFLGTTGPENQIKQFHHFMTLVDKHMEEALASRNKNRKVVLNMGILGGLLVVLLMI